MSRSHGRSVALPRSRSCFPFWSVIRGLHFIRKWQAPKGARRLLSTEQGHDGGRTLVGDRQRLDAQLLLGLKSLKASGGFLHVGVD